MLTCDIIQQEYRLHTLQDRVFFKMATATSVMDESTGTKIAMGYLILFMGYGHIQNFYPPLSLRLRSNELT